MRVLCHMERESHKGEHGSAPSLKLAMFGRVMMAQVLERDKKKR